MKNTLKYALLFYLTFQVVSANAQKKYLFSKDYWHKGQVELKSGEQIRGFIKYFLDTHVIMVKSPNNTLATYQSFQINHFEILDTLTKVKRFFHTLPFQNGSYKAQKVFFETLFIGNLSLLTREKIVNKPYISPTQPKSINQYYQVLEDNFFLVTNIGKIQQFEGLGTLSSVLGESMKNLEDFIIKNNLDLTQRKDFAFLIDYYDQKNRSESASAK
jgi:hypothetical protein